MQAKAQKFDFTQGSIIKSLAVLTLPIIFGSLLQTAYQFTDAFWVGKLGKDALAAVSVSFPFIFLMIALGNGFTMAGSIFVSQYMGAKNEKMVNHVSGQTLLLVLLISFVLGTIGYLVAPMLLNLMSVELSVYESALSFLRISCLGLVSVFGFFSIQAIFRGIGEVKMPIFIVLGTVLLNFILDPLFINGFGFVPSFGVAGAAWATLITQTLAMIIGLIFLFKGSYGIHISLNDLRPDFSFIKKAFFLALPSSIEVSTRALGVMVMTILVASFGTATIAAYGVGSNVFQLAMVPAMSIAVATATLAGQNIGAKKIERVVEIGKVSSLIGFVVLGFLSIIAFIFATKISELFISNDKEVIEIATNYIHFLAFAFPFMGIQFALSGILRGAGSMKATMTISLVAQWLIQFPLAYFLSKYTSLGVSGIWLAFPLSFVLNMLIVIVYYRLGKWKEIKLIEGSEEAMQEKVAEEAMTEEGR